MIDINLPQTGKSPEDFPDLHNLGLFYERLGKAFARIKSIRPYQIEDIGYVNGLPIYLITPEDLDNKSNNILTAGGFHGEEPAGPWGILRYLETADSELLSKVNHSFLPLVNPTGFAAATRLNRFGENPNRGFVAVPPEMEIGASGCNSMPSAEGKVLMKHFIRLHNLAKDGFVTQHEDWRLSEGFIFANEYSDNPSNLTTQLRDVIANHFDLLPDGGNKYIPDVPVKDGIYMNDEDSSFECLLHYKKVPFVATTETPGQLAPEKRIACNKDITEAFARLNIK